MKRAFAVLAILVFTMIISGNHTYAQMMGNHGMMGNNQSQPATMTQQQRTKGMTDTTLSSMMKHSEMASSQMMKDFSHLQSDFAAAMKSDNMQTLKADMEGLQNMMTSIKREMSNEMQMQQRMMHSSTMNGSSKMHSGMMGMTRDGNSMSEPANPNPNSDVK